MPVTLEQGLQGLGLLGQILALPRSAQFAQQEATQKRALLKDLFTPEQVMAAAPDAPLQWLSADRPGIGGKILGGVGDVGTVLTTLVGRPIGPPRATIGELAQIRNAQMAKEKREAQQRAIAMIGTDAKPADLAKAFAEAGAFDAAGRILNPEVKYSPYERTQMSQDAARAERAKQRGALLAAGYDPKDVEFFISTGGWPPQGRQTPADVQQDALTRARAADQAERERRQRVVDEHAGWTQVQKDHYIANGVLPAEARPDQETSPDWFIQQAYTTFVNQKFRQPTEQELQVITAQGTAAYNAYIKARRAPGMPGFPAPPPDTPVKPEEQPTAAPGASKAPTPGQQGSNQVPGTGGANVAQVPGPPPMPVPGPAETAEERAQRGQARAVAIPKILSALDAGLTPLAVAQQFPQEWAALALPEAEKMTRENLTIVLRDPTFLGQLGVAPAQKPEAAPPEQRYVPAGQYAPQGEDWLTRTGRALFGSPEQQPLESTAPTTTTTTLLPGVQGPPTDLGPLEQKDPNTLSQLGRVQFSQILQQLATTTDPVARKALIDKAAALQ